jgi:dTDP-4-dehydrorhamnose reductase
LIDGEAGVWHLANAGVTNWADFARLAAAEAGFDARLIDDCPTRRFNFSARRPIYSALTSERGGLMPSLEDAVARYVRDCEVSWAGVAGARPSAKSASGLRAASAGKNSGA